MKKLDLLVIVVPTLLALVGCGGATNREASTGTDAKSQDAKSQAVETMERLRDSGHRFEPTKLEAWAMAHGWQARDAQDLRQMAEAISGGKRYQARRGVFVANIVQLWEEEAAEKR